MKKLFQLNIHIKMKNRKLSPIISVLVTVWNFVLGKIHFPKEYNGVKIRMEDNHEFEVFRHVIIGRKEDLLTNQAIFVVRFKLKKMSIEKNKRFSKFPIPMFIGLPGFKAKFWMCEEQTGYNQGVYQWETEQDAVNYSKSFAVRFMTSRSEPNSVSYLIVPKKDIYEYFNELKI